MKKFYQTMAVVSPYSTIVAGALIAHLSRGDGATQEQDTPCLVAGLILAFVGVGILFAQQAQSIKNNQKSR